MTWSLLRWKTMWSHKAICIIGVSLQPSFSTTAKIFSSNQLIFQSTWDTLTPLTYPVVCPSLNNWSVDNIPNMIGARKAWIQSLKIMVRVSIIYIYLIDILTCIYIKSKPKLLGSSEPKSCGKQWSTIHALLGSQMNVLNTLLLIFGL